MAIAEAYRRKKRQEANSIRKEEVQKAKKFTEIINDRGSRSSRRARVLEVSPFCCGCTTKLTKTLQDVENGKDREKALDKRIDEIKEQNKAILKRNKEIEKDKELYG